MRGMKRAVVAGLALGLASVPAGAQPSGTVVTVAGNGAYGYGGDGGSATLAPLNPARGLAVDPEGNLYLADTENNRVRRVDARTGIITTVAGNGAQGYSGDGGPAVDAMLNWPFDVALGPDATILYIADAHNRRVRRVDLVTGIITTVAGTGSVGSAGDGGPATKAFLTLPSGLAVDATGVVYVSDHAAQVVRRIELDGTITAVAGTGVGGYWGDGEPATRAWLHEPFGLAIDGAGNLFIADTLNARVRRVDPSGTITTVAGIGQPVPLWQTSTVPIPGVLIGDGGPAVAASVSRPFDVALDAEGNLYIADKGHNRVRRVDPDGTIDTVAGNGVNGFSGDGGPALDATFRGPEWVVVDASGNLFISDADNVRVRRVALSP